MPLDDRAFRDVFVESQDLQADALRDVQAVRPHLREVGEARRGRPVDLDAVRHYDLERRRLLRNGGFGLGALAARGLLATGFGAALTSIVAAPASAQEEVDVQILQTAASLENLAVATYEAALGLEFVSTNATVRAFAEMTMRQHAEHGDSFNAQAADLGGERQTDPNPKYAAVVEDAKPGLTDLGKVVSLAIDLEQVATQTYLANLTLLEDTETRALMASVMGVESQHLAVLRAADALIRADLPELVTIDPAVDAAALPEAAGSVAFPQPFESTDNASPPEEGAVQ